MQLQEKELEPYFFPLHIGVQSLNLVIQIFNLPM